MDNSLSESFQEIHERIECIRYPEGLGPNDTEVDFYPKKKVEPVKKLLKELVTYYKVGSFLIHIAQFVFSIFVVSKFGELVIMMQKLRSGEYS